MLSTHAEALFALDKAFPGWLWESNKELVVVGRMLYTPFQVAMLRKDGYWQGAKKSSADPVEVARADIKSIWPRLEKWVREQKEELQAVEAAMGKGVP